MNSRMKTLYAVSSAVAVLFLSSCGPDTKTIRRMQAIEEHVDNPATIDELTDAISRYKGRIEDVLNADMKIGLWYKILAIRYLDTGMYAKALENFRTAIEYYPTNQNLYYYVGVCAGYMAKASLDFEAKGSTPERDRYLALAESAYLRAIELEPKYGRALYGLAILYAFELNQPEKAIPPLETIMDSEAANYDAMFLLARTWYATGDADKAVAMYDKILSMTGDKQRKADAEKNKAAILNSTYGKK